MTHYPSELFPQKSIRGEMKNDEWLLFLIANLFFFGKHRHSQEAQEKIIVEYAAEVKNAILQCSAAELTRVSEIICRGSEKDPAKLYVRLENFARTLFDEIDMN